MVSFPNNQSMARNKLRSAASYILKGVAEKALSVLTISQSNIPILYYEEIDRGNSKSLSLNFC